MNREELAAPKRGPWTAKDDPKWKGTKETREERRGIPTDQEISPT
jgi:hypothetical protein